VRGLYDRTLRLAASRHAVPALFVLSFAESSFFPIPPDVMLLPMCIAKRARAFYFALVCSAGSVLGGIAGYAIGHFLWERLRDFFFANIPGFTQDGFDRVAALYADYDFWVVFTAGFTPIPYKLITISAGVFEIAFPAFVVASVVSRSARFFIVAGVCYRFGSRAQELLEKHFTLVAITFVILLIAGFWAAGKI
jgi:membrane protein YqaA with SNARE-associated domain